jgi:hypothetical protein
MASIRSNNSVSLFAQKKNRASTAGVRGSGRTGVDDSQVEPKLYKKSVKDPSNPKRKKVIDKPTGLYGCYAPKGEPYSSCMDRGVIFTEGKD